MQLFLVALALLALTGTAMAAGTISGQVTRSSDGSGVADASVVAAAPDQPPVTAPTGGDGSYSLNVAGNGPFGVAVQASGFGGQSVGGVQANATQNFALEPATYTPLPVYAGAGQTVSPDGTSGIFFASMGGAPEVYRTTDYGGSWQPVTMSYDDPDTGLNRSNVSEPIAVSSISGEIAVANPGAQGLYISYSTDYGLTWDRIDTQVNVGGTTDKRMFWAHARPGAENVLMVAAQEDDGSWRVFRADMSAAGPAFTQEPSDPFGQGAEIAVADSANGSFVGRVSQSGALSFAPLTAGGPIAFGPDEATGLPSPPQILRLGGAEEQAAPPDGALVVGSNSDPYKAVLLSKPAGAATFSGASFSAVTDLPFTNPTNCEFGRLLGGSVAPTTTGTSGAGNASSCWLQKDAANPLTVTPGLTDGADMTYDAAYGQGGNQVSMMASIASGPMKFARLSGSGVPVGQPQKIADPGTGPDSGGNAIRGITSPIVKDTAYGPLGESQQAVSAMHVVVASKDGGQTMTEVVPRSGGLSEAVQWWQGASGEWLLFGHGFNCNNMLTAILNWDGGPTGLIEPNVDGSSCADLSGPPEGYWGTGGYVVGALAPVPGTDTVFMGLGTWGEDKYGSGDHLYRARLNPGNPPSLADVVRFDPDPASVALYSPRAMAYCPEASATDPDVADVLFVATADFGFSTQTNRGSLLRITDATGTPTTSVVGSIPHDSANTHLTDVRAHCETGTVYAGGGLNFVQETALYKSTDGGQTFSPITVPGQDPGQVLQGVTAIGLNPADPNDVTIASGGPGTVAHSTDGGSTWTIVYDPSVERPSEVNDIEVPPAAGSRRTAAAARSGTASRPALVGTVSGAFHGDVAAAAGLMGQVGTAGGRVPAGVQITPIASDQNPAVVVPTTGGRVTVFQRSNGLASAFTTTGSWSAPAAIPGTVPGDAEPDAVTDAAGRLHVAFARRGSRPGVNLTTRDTSGAWSAPRRVGTKKGDTLPAIAVVGQTTHVAFLRTRGSGRGVYHSSNRGGKWRRAAKLPGTGGADAKVALGGPSLAPGSNSVHVAFARASGKPGIYYSATRKSKWAKPKRLSTRKGDDEPSLVVDQKGTRHIAFSRSRGKGRGLVALRGKKTWSTRRIAGTGDGDGEPALAVSGSSLVLAFARPAGGQPGIYFDQATAGKRWQSPQRWSGSPDDADPSLGSDPQGNVTLVFER